MKAHICIWLHSTQLVEALRYRPKRVDGNFHDQKLSNLNTALSLTNPLTEIIAWNISSAVKVAVKFDYLEIWKPKIPGKFRAFSTPVIGCLYIYVYVYKKFVCFK
jgi:hypothetical protein